MHYCTIVLTKERPSEEQLEGIMSPYNDDHIEKFPEFTWDYYVIGGRYDSRLKMKTDFLEVNSMKLENGKTFDSSRLSEIKNHWKPMYGYDRFREYEFYGMLGVEDGFMRVDGCEINRVMNIDDIHGYNIIDTDGYACTRSHWNGEELIDQEEKYESFRKVAFEKCQKENGYITILDIHD